MPDRSNDIAPSSFPGSGIVYTLRRRVLIPMLAAFTLAIVFGVIVIQQTADNARKGMLRERIERVETDYNRRLEIEAFRLFQAIDTLKANSEINMALRNSDREQLLSLSSGLSSEFRGKYRTTHFYFMAPDRQVIARIHNPPRYGDIINRVTMLEAERTGKEFWGLEMGPFQTFTLRAVSPWFFDGELIGYVELGEEVGHLIPAVARDEKCALISVLHKKLLDREPWEEGMRMVGEEPEWERFPLVVLTGSSMKEIPGFVENILMHIEDHDIQSGASNFIFKHEGAQYALGYFNLKDVTGKEFGHVLAVLDQSELAAHFNKARTAIVIFLSISVIALVLFMYEVTGNATQVLHQRDAALENARRELATANEQLQKDIEVQKAAEKKNNELMRQIMFKNEELESFTHSVSHDLKSPLVTIKGFAEILEEEKKDALGEDGEDYLQRINRNVMNMSQLIDDLLEYSRIGKTEESFSKESFRKLVGEAVEAAGTNGSANKPEIAVQETDTEIYCIKGHVKQVFQNLVSNAIKYMDPENRHPRIEIGFIQENDEKVYYVKDNGSGISPENKEAIFKMFQRGPKTKNIEGTGVGLAIVKRIIELHGGRIWLESTPGEGSTFSFTLQEPEA